MKIREVNKNKKQFISLLLLADEQESILPCGVVFDVKTIFLCRGIGASVSACPLPATV